jgi:hypothetical protein
VCELALISQVSAAAKRPLIAAGRITNGCGIAAALILGAQAAQLDTAFLGYPKWGIHPGWKQRLQEARKKPGQAGLRRASAQGLNICSLLTFGASGHVKGDLLIFGERFEAFALNCRKVGKQIITTIVRFNEAVAFRFVKPFHSTSCQVEYS